MKVKSSSSAQRGISPAGFDVTDVKFYIGLSPGAAAVPPRESKQRLLHRKTQTSFGEAEDAEQKQPSGEDVEAEEAETAADVSGDQEEPQASEGAEDQDGSDRPGSEAETSPQQTWEPEDEVGVSEEEEQHPADEEEKDEVVHTTKQDDVGAEPDVEPPARKARGSHARSPDGRCVRHVKVMRA